MSGASVSHLWKSGYLQLSALLVWSSLATFGPDSRADERVDFFETRIRPILAQHCYACHGPQESLGKLRLDTRAGWQKGGASGPAIVPGDPSSSLLVKAVRYQDAKLKMPPPDEADRL